MCVRWGREVECAWRGTVRWKVREVGPSGGMCVAWDREVECAWRGTVRWNVCGWGCGAC